jgi:hypothetical protein
VTDDRANQCLDQTAADASPGAGALAEAERQRSGCLRVHAAVAEAHDVAPAHSGAITQNAANLHALGALAEEHMALKLLIDPLICCAPALGVVCLGRLPGPSAAMGKIFCLALLISCC